MLLHCVENVLPVTVLRDNVVPLYVSVLAIGSPLVGLMLEMVVCGSYGVSPLV